MKRNKALSIIAIICAVVLAVNKPCSIDVTAATSASFQLSDNVVSKKSSNSIEVSIVNNSTNIAGIEIFVAFDTSALAVDNVKSLVSASWELDWKIKTNETYGKGIHCMLYDSDLTGFSKSVIDILELDIDAQNAKAGNKYDFKIYVIDVCDKEGDSIKSSLSNYTSSLECVEGVSEAEAIKLVGYQMSAKVKGFRAIATVEPRINGKEVVEFGHIYGINLNDLKDRDLYVGNDNEYVKAYKATENGISKAKYTDSDTAINYVRTMKNNGYVKDGFVQEYAVRAYAKLSDGTYIYSEVGRYTLYNVASYLYENVMMPTEAGHEYLYTDILKVVDKNYKKINYIWDNVIIPTKK